MLYCPFRFPESASNRFAGGTFRSSKHPAFSIIISLRKATLCMSWGSFLENIWLYIFSVSLSAKLFIMLWLYTSCVYTSISSYFAWRELILVRHRPVISKHRTQQKSSTCAILTDCCQNSARLRYNLADLKGCTQLFKIMYIGRLLFDFWLCTDLKYQDLCLND